MNGNPEELRSFTLLKNRFLRKDTACYYVLDYLRYGVPDNPYFILTLKNTFNSESADDLAQAMDMTCNILLRWVPTVMSNEGLSSSVMVCVPRAKALNTYTPQQCGLLSAVSEAAELLENVTNGTDAIVRVVNTKTTHLRNTVSRVTANRIKEPNTGAEPYPGITRDTCQIDARLIRQKDILLVDDIYTAGVNIDEDCIQALYDAGAKSVTLFALSCTK